MEVKSYNHHSVAEWSNSKLHSQLLACAQINPDQNNMYNLDILSLDLSDRSKNLNVVGNAFYNIPFRCLAWDTFGQKQNTYPNGIIFGGMQDGSYTLWNAAEMTTNYGRNTIQKSEQTIESQSAFLYGQQADQGAYPIMCAEWNSLKNNYLAFGSTDLLILDIGKDISNPQIKKPGNRNPHQGSYITSVSWNKQVANILASASQNGLIALWDVKGNRSIFQFKDSPSTNAGGRNVVICWSKTISTQLAVTLDDQKRNQLQIWDLRNQKGPVAIFDRGHTKGINTMQWCQTDPQLILTGGRDNKIVCWNYTQEESPISTHNLDGPISDIKWSKKLKSIYSVSFQDKTQIFTMDNTNLFSYVPKWFRVPIQSAFFANDSFMKYSENQGQKLTQTKIIVHNSSENSNLQSLLKDLQAALDQNSLEQKSKENQFWNLINIKNNSTGDEAIYDYLGFNKQKIIKQVQKYTGKKRQNLQVKAQTQPKYKSKAYTRVIGQQAASFFASIGESQVKNTGSPVEQDEQNQSVKYDMVPRNFNWNIGKQRLIKDNIFIGNYQGAIDAAIKCGRTAEALIIAYSVDTNTFNSTLKTFFTQTTDNFITDVLKNITYRDNQELVRKYDLENWKQCVAMIHSISTSDKRKQLLNLLASRIREESLRKTGKSVDNDILSQDNPAIQCYILSENFNQIANLYFDNLRSFQSGTTQRKQAVVEYAKRLIMIFNSLSVQIQPSKNFQKVIREAAFIATEENFKMVSYLIFSNYIFETSMKEVDMIIHATKNLEQYRNSIVFKQINIPVMQFKQLGPSQKAKKGANQQLHQQHSNVARLGQPIQQGNLNIPTKDKTPPRPPIFNKRQQERQAPKHNSVPPPPPSHAKVKHQAFEQEEQQPQVANMKKNPQKRVPPPPGLKGPSPKSSQVNIPVTHQQQYHTENSQTSFDFGQKKPMPQSIKNRKAPPPPPQSNISHIHQNPRQQQMPTSSTHYTQQPPKRNVPRPPQNRIPAQQTRVPPPLNRMPRQQQYQQEEQEVEEQQPQHFKNNQRFHPQQQSNVVQQKKVNPPPPPSMQKPPVMKTVSQHYERQQQNQSSSSNRVPQPHSYSRTPQLSGLKKNPPPPPIKKQQSNGQYEQNVHKHSNEAVKPPPPNKLGSRVPPPPPNRIQPQQTTKNYPQQQQYTSYQEPTPQQETPSIKRPPPPVSGKKGPPPPPRR